MPRSFAPVDVFTTTPYSGNPVAVVLDAAGLSTEEDSSAVLGVRPREREPRPRPRRGLPPGLA